MDPLPTVLLRPGEADRVVAGHPWIYHGSVLRLTAPAEDGAIVQVKDHRQRFLGIGFYNSKSKINVRLLARERLEVDRRFLFDRIRAAGDVRKKYLPEATSYRLVNSESDFLSGLIIDKYENVFVLQISALGMERLKPEIVDVLQELFSPQAILERNDAPSRKFEGLPETRGLLAGTIAGEVEVKMNGLTFTTDLLGGHKTGMYLDQQINYREVAELVGRLRSPQVLDCFCFQGAFALHVARAGAAHVHGVEQSEEALTKARANASANGLADKISFEAANVFDWLKAQTAAKPHEKIIPPFDAVILDPPSFTRSRASLPDALRGYKEIHLRALKLLKPQGQLLTFCCSHHVLASLFEEVIVAAAVDAHRVLRRIRTFSQSPDHPIIPAIPETEYLKGFAFEVVN